MNFQMTFPARYVSLHPYVRKTHRNLIQPGLNDMNNVGRNNQTIGGMA